MNDKIITTAKNLDTLAKVGGKIAQVFGIVCIIFAALVLVFGEKVFVANSLTLDLDFVKLHLSNDFQAITDIIKIYALLALLIAAVICFIIYYASKLARNILSPMKEGRPFESEVAANLKKTAMVVLVGGAAAEILGIVERVLITKAYPFEQIFSSAAISKIEYVFTIDFGFVLIACVILFLSYIFTYGQTLQRESDETL